jgi:hypothetical protein
VNDDAIADGNRISKEKSKKGITPTKG